MTEYLKIERKIRDGAPYNNPSLHKIEFEPTSQITDVDYIISFHEMTNSFTETVNGKKDYLRAHVENRGDILVGFYAPDSSANLIVEFGNSSHTHKYELSAGEFKFALDNKYIIPTLRTSFQPLYCENVVGKVYSVHAFLNEKYRKPLVRSRLYIIANFIFIDGLMIRIQNICEEEPIIIYDTDEAKRYMKNKHISI